MNFYRLVPLVSAVFVATIGLSQVDGIECGTVILYQPATLGGTEVIKDEWPFIAALYYSATSEYFCGGTIISHRHILTAAHCIQTKGKGVPLSHDELTVRLGAYNLTDRSEKDAVDRSVTHIHVHPHWNTTNEKYDADIAILVLNENITFSNHIRPVCMPPGEFLMDGLMGTVVGWGKTENGTAEGIPRKIEINALSDAYCYERDDGIARYASEGSFCGEGSGTPNDGDSGGGFFAIAGSGWVQFGTVSFIRPMATGNDLKVALYMKLSSLRDWIAEKVDQSGGEISVATTTANLDCFYLYAPLGGYACMLFDLNIRQENFEVKEFIGSHAFDKDNDDVEMMIFLRGVMASLPRNVGNIFKNLKSILVTVDTRRISRSHFQHLERLELIMFTGSSVAELDENSLWDLPNLQTFALEKSKLKLLHAATFSRNYQLRDVQLASNALKSLPRNLFGHNLLLEEVSFNNNSIETIDETIFETNANLSTVSLMENRLKHLSENLFRNNSELQFVDLSSNHIQTVDEHSFKANSKLVSIHLESNALELLPEQLLQGLSVLEVFNVGKNILNVIDERFFETNARIDTIYLRFNQLTHIPSNLFHNNSQLKLVDLSSNSIEAIDENLFEANSLLQTVHLTLNRLVKLPVSLFRHNSMLEFVYAEFNSLQRIGKRTFEWNPRLRQINIERNYVTSISGKLFENNLLLETVNFNSNSLRELDEQTFRMNAYLQEVHLSSNWLDHLPENLFRNNPKLQVVNLSDNRFTSLNGNIFSTNANLESIFLRGGQLQSLSRNLFEGNSRLKYIDFSHGSLQNIEADFTLLKHVNYINLSGNVCIDAVFNDDESDDSYKLSNETRNLTELQGIVLANCS